MKIERARRGNEKEEKRHPIVLWACAMRVEHVPSRRASRRRLSRLARRRGQLGTVSTRVPTPGDASVGRGVVLLREPCQSCGLAFRRKACKICESNRKRTEKKVRGQRSQNKNICAYGASCRTLTSIMLHFFREVIFLDK